MKRLVHFTLEGEERLITAEVDVTERPGIDKAGASEKAVIMAAHSFQKAIDTIRPIAEAISSKMSDLSHSPDKVEIEFGLKLNAELGAIIASTSGEGNITLKLSWNHEKSESISPIARETPPT